MQVGNNKICKIYNKATDRMEDCLEVDSEEYDILIEAVIATRGVPGISCEIGVRGGGSSSIIMLCYHINSDDRYHIGIDPYGNIDYVENDTSTAKYDYTNDMKIQALADIHQWCMKHRVQFQLFNMEDVEFFKRFSDGVPVYNETKSIINRYCLVFFDGPHSVRSVKKEVEFFRHRTPKGGAWVFDNIDVYDHQQIHNLITGWGMKEGRRGTSKVSYFKTI